MSGQRLVAHLRSGSESPESELESGGFSGTCENASLSDWIQLVQMNRRDAVVGIKHRDGRKALLWCREGDVIDAWCDGIIGEEAVYRALAWDGGRVSVAFTPFERERRIEMTTPALLLHAAQRKDSGVRQCALRPSAIAFLAVDERSPDSAAPASDDSPGPVSLPLPPRLPTLPSPSAPARFPKRPRLPTPNAAGAESEAPILPVFQSSSLTRFGSATPPNAPPPQVASPQVAPPQVAPLEVAKEQVAPPGESEPKAAGARSETPRARAVATVTAAVRRIRERSWLPALVLGLVPLVALGASWLVTPRGDSTPSSARRLATHAEPARPAVAPVLRSEPSRAHEATPASQPLATTPPPLATTPPPLATTPPRQPEKAAPAPRRAVANWAGKAPVKGPASSASPLAPSKGAAKVKEVPQSVEERAPRVQIIEERAAKIEVIE